MQKHFSLPYVPAKAVYYKKGTPRFFEYELSDQPIKKKPKEQIDGFINLIFPVVKQGETETSLQDVLAFSAATKEAIIYAYFTHHTSIATAVYAINKIEYLLNQQEIREDRIAKRELEDLKYFEIQELNNLVFNYLFDKSEKIVWIYAGEQITIDSQTKFNKQLSIICDDIYFGTPTFRNELVNREKISGSISTARKNYFKKLLKNWSKEDIAFDKQLFPAEKTIYLTLLRQTGIHHQTSPIHYELGKPLAESFQLLWQASEDFLESAKYSQRSLTDFEKILFEKPFKLKKGFADFWLPTFLFIKRNDYALFNKEEYVPHLSFDEIDLLYKNLYDYKIKTFNVEGVRLDIFNKYRELLNKDILQVATESSFIETIKPFLSFYHQLPKYAKQTQRLEHHTLQFRAAIRTATDPEQTFFEVFPRALGFHNLEMLKNDESALANYMNYLQTAIRELRTAYDNLLDRVELFIVSELSYEGQGFEDYKLSLQKRYKSIKKHLLLPHQKIFYVRLDSPIEDRNDWLNNLVSGVLRKSLRDISDEEEILLYEKLSTMLQELDNLCDIHKIEINRVTEEVVKIEITSLETGTKPYQVRFSKTKTDEADELYTKIKALLSKDAKLNQSVLIKLLKEILD